MADQVGELALQVPELGKVVLDDVGVAGIPLDEVLVLFFGRVEVPGSPPA